MIPEIILNKIYWYDNKFYLDKWMTKQKEICIEYDKLLAKNVYNSDTGCTFIYKYERLLGTYYKSFNFRVINVSYIQIRRINNMNLSKREICGNVATLPKNY